MNLLWTWLRSQNVALEESCLIPCLVLFTIATACGQYHWFQEGTSRSQLKDSQVAAKCSVDRGGTPAHLLKEI